MPNFYFHSRRYSRSRSACLPTQKYNIPLGFPTLPFPVSRQHLGLSNSIINALSWILTIGFIILLLSVIALLLWCLFWGVRWLYRFLVGKWKERREKRKKGGGREGDDRSEYPPGMQVERVLERLRRREVERVLERLRRREVERRGRGMRGG
ncbi:hypothetical protein P154DRAFT_559268 [Amniculicola lignicola CBS 123094]|uniref:Uncharacterized protein n=1 Tax=Amniculicola lignicola CBS 123094 TaxID=1392246 RepID=A0A6A5X0M1_9PLEO|nr:hypothetical protein P154DRAFT_559268 [Amniculicola lignicola CBS 123094]